MASQQGNAVAAFLKELQRFTFELSSADHVWDVVSPTARGSWQYLRVVKYRDTYYVTAMDAADREDCSLEFTPGKPCCATDPWGSASRPLDGDRSAAGWEPRIVAARRWLKVVERDWRAANARVVAEYPRNRRFGTVPHALVRDALPDVYRLDEELGLAKARKFVRLVEGGYFIGDRNTRVEAMTAADFFAYCKVAYVAGRRKDEVVDDTKSGRELYEQFADGRHEGLLEIDETSAQEFADWIDGTHPKRERGGHPWEIKRGGNTTHINLSVRRPSFHEKAGFTVELCGASIGRMVETLRMFLALHAASLPIAIVDPEGVRRRLLVQDNIGLVPCHASLHRANQHFRPDENVFDVMYYDDLGRYKRRMAPFITWEPLPILRPRSL